MSLVKLIELKECGEKHDFILEDAGPEVGGLPQVCHASPHLHLSQPLISSLASQLITRSKLVLKSMAGHESRHMEVMLTHYLPVHNSRLSVCTPCASVAKGENIALVQINQHKMLRKPVSNPHKFLIPL